MARLPEPGADSGVWGDVLNDFLSVEHNSDGSLKLGGTLGSYAPLDNPIFTGTVTVPNPSSATDAVTKSYVDTLVGGVSAPDATTSTKGVVQLAGDLSGTATNPQIADGAITNANINAAAGIAQNKIADLTTDLSSKQPLDADLTTVAGLSPNNDDVLQRKGGAWTNRSPAQLKPDLGLTRSDVGLGSVDNTADADKPVSTATQMAIDAHVNDTADAHDASAISFSPTGSIAATDVQAAIAEVASEAGGTAGHVIKEDGGAGLTQRANLNFGNGLDATDNSGTNATDITVDLGEYTGSDLPVTAGGTGASDAATARTNLGLGNSATRDIGTSNGTVSAGDDSRYTTVTANNQTGTTYILALSDAGQVVEFNNSSAITVTVPLNSSAAFAVGTVIELWQQGVGQVTVAPEGGVIIRSTDSNLKLTTQYSGASLRKRSTDEWVLVGDLTS